MLKRTFERLTTHAKKYSQQIGERPVKFLVSFAILHELTAILPLPILYLAFQKVPDSWIPIDDSMRERADRVVARLIPGSIFESKDIACLGAAYVVVKALMPVRIGACVYLAPRMVKWIVKRIKL
jgi:hypothetical protein